jgi:hypothetical protein
MPGTAWIQHKGKNILFIDFARSTFQDIQLTIAQGKEIIVKEPPESILALVDTTDSRFSLEVSTALKEFTAHNKPYMKMTALIGVSGLQKTIYNGVILFTRRKNLILKNSREEALDWLVTQ